MSQQFCLFHKPLIIKTVIIVFITHATAVGGGGIWCPSLAVVFEDGAWKENVSRNFGYGVKLHVSPLKPKEPQLAIGMKRAWARARAWRPWLIAGCGPTKAWGLFCGLILSRASWKAWNIYGPTGSPAYWCLPKLETKNPKRLKARITEARTNSSWQGFILRLVTDRQTADWLG